jgi:hypothetical protein
MFTDIVGNIVDDINDGGKSCVDTNKKILEFESA